MSVIQNLQDAFYVIKPDVAVEAQRVAFGLPATVVRH